MSFPSEGPSLTGFRTRVPQPRRNTGRRVLLVVGLSLAAFVTRAFFPQVLDHPIAFYPGPPGSMIYVDPVRSWALRFPSTWDAEQFSEGRSSFGRGGVQRSGVLLSNIAHDGGSLPWSPWFERRGVPSKLVALQVGFAIGWHFTIYCLHDTPLPLTLKNAKATGDTILDDVGMPVTNRSLRFSIGGLPYHWATVWIGSQASKADVAIMEGIVRSISYKVTGDPEFGQDNCMDI